MALEERECPVLVKGRRERPERHGTDARSGCEIRRIERTRNGAPSWLYSRPAKSMIVPAGTIPGPRMYGWFRFRPAKLLIPERHYRAQLAWIRVRSRAGLRVAARAGPRPRS